MPLASDRVKRIIHFYELIFSFDTDSPSKKHDNIKAVFSDIVALAKARDKSRYQSMNDKFLFINDITFVPTDKYIKGKLLSIRTDLMPELMNMSNDEISNITAKAEEGIVETNHFIVYYGGRRVYLALEYNQPGAKIQDFVYYVSSIPKRTVKLQSVDKLNVVRDNIDEMKRRIKDISALNVRLHKENQEVVKEFDDNTATAMRSLLNIDDIEYASLDIKFKVRRKGEAAIDNSNFDEDSSSIVDKIISGIKRGRITKQNVDKILVVAKDEDDNERMALFDLLFDKVKANVLVERNPKSRTIISSQMFELMWSKMLTQRLI